MGVWGTGAFENDEALDWSAALTPESGWAPVEAAFSDLTPPGEWTDVDAAMQALAAEVVAASRGYAAPDFPETLARYIKSIGAADAALAARAAEAVSNVLMEPSELVELWTESDEAEGGTSR